MAQPTATYILGKPSEYARRSHAGAWSESQTEFPGTLAIDHTNQRLFLVDNATGQSLPGVGSQIMVFDIHPDRIETGQKVLAVLGQPHADSKTIGLAANHVGRRLGLAVDEANQRLFTSDGSNNRVLIFDISPNNFRTGMDASVVLGQGNFTSREPGLDAYRLSRPGALAYDPENQRLFVSDNGNRRVMIFDVAPDRLQTFAAATDVMGQPDFNTSEPRTNLTGFATGGLAYDNRTARLFIAEQVSRIEHMRISVYEVEPGTSLRSAVPMAVLGKPGFDAYDPIVSREQSVWPRLGSASIDSERQLLVATEGYPGGNRAIIWDISPERLRTGMPAVEVVGHLDDEGHTDFERRAANDRVTPRNIYPRDVVLDPIDHRLFAIDQYNNRVLVWQLDRQNRIKDRDARWVIGQPDLYSGKLYPIGPTTVKIPLAVTYDTEYKRVFVSDGWGNRIMVFDAHPDRLTNGPEAIAVLGQPNFTSILPAVTADGLNLDTRVGTGITPTRPRGTGLAYDPINDRLFVSDGGNNRVLIYEVAPDQLQTGMPASVVLGQPDFTSNERHSTQAGFYQPAALLYETKQQRLFVSDGNNNRVLVFDAMPDGLVNGAEPSVVIGQPDFASFATGRSQTIIDGPDGLAYDYAKDRLFVSDHGNDRILIFDAHPDRLDNGPLAQHVIGQPDFETRQLGPVRADEIWDPRGLTFDSVHQRLYVSQGFASNIMLHDLARSTYESAVPARGVQAYQSSSASTELETQRGWAMASGTTPPNSGIAMLTRMTTQFDELSQRESRVLISETGIVAPPLVRTATVFVPNEEHRQTIADIVNPNETPITVTLTAYSEAGTASQGTSLELAAQTGATWTLNDYVDSDGSSSIMFLSDHNFGLVSTTVATNDRNEDIVTSAPMVHGVPPKQDHPLTFPRIQVGNGYQTKIILLNTSDETLMGALNFFALSGEPLTIGGASEFSLNIPPHGAHIWDSTNHATTVEAGFAMFTSYSGTPSGSAIVSFHKGQTLVSEHQILSGSIRESWFPIETYPSIVRHGQTSFTLFATNDTEGAADVRLLVYNEDGQLLKRTYQILPAGRQVAFTHVDLADKGNFRGSVRIISDIAIAMTAEQKTVNLRNETITALLPSMTSTGSPKSTVLFPIYRDGPEQATQLFLLNGTEDNRIEFNFYREDGTELSAILR